jgi:hypothetical protein
MAIAAKISSAELTDQLVNRFVDSVFEARLINASGTVYEPGVTNDATFLGFEVTLGTGGYQRQVISYSNTDVSLYGDGGVSMVTKATVFAQDGSATSIPFSHAALVWSTGNVTALDAPSTTPTAGVDGTYTNIPVTSVGGSGVGLKIDLQISGTGTVFDVFLSGKGYGYASADVLQVPEAVLAGIGAVSTGDGNLDLSVDTVSTPSQAGQIFSVAKVSSPAVLTAGNEAVFYWNLKQFGFFNV